MSEHTPSGNRLDNPSVRSEPTDLNFRGVALFAAGLVAILVVVAAGVWGFLHVMAAREAEHKRVEYPWPRETPRTETAAPVRDDRSQLPPLPRLEGFDPGPVEGKSDIKEQVAREQKRLSEYGWIDRKTGVVHIPIREAMKKTAGQLKARDGKDDDEFLQAPSGSSSGRMPRGGSK
jgi:hypothetical protein